VRFELLGPLRVHDNGATIEIGGPRQQRVLACLLASHPDAITVDRLVDEVWGDRPPKTARHVLRTYVSNLRKVLGNRIISTGNRYRLDLHGDEVDALEAKLALEAARGRRTDEALVVMETLESAVKLWRGRPFGDLADDSPQLKFAAVDLEEVRLAVEEELMELELEAGRHEAVILRVEHLIREHPYRERLHAHRMLALYRAGRQAEALRAYAEARSRLVEDLGIEPSPELRDLEERILLQDAGLALVPPHVLPAPVSSFVGRRYELGEVAKLVEAHRLVTLTGPGGVGKTRLAIEAARAVLGDHPGGVWWVDLSTTAASGDVLDRIGRVVGVGGSPGVRMIDALANFVDGRSTLMVVDNCEHLLPGVGAVVVDLLERAAELRVLCTSRAALAVLGEIRWVVPPMSLPIADEPRGVSDAERLFITRAESLGVRIDRDDPEIARAVGGICRGLDGLPLAIELAAARTTVFALPRLRDELATHLGILESTAPGLPHRHRTLGAAIEWSHRLLTPQQQALFARLSGFASGFDVDAGVAIAGFDPLEPDHVIPAFDALVTASMIHRVGDGVDATRYRLLDTVRRYATQRLSDRGEVDRVATRHAEYHLELIERAGETRLTERFADWAEVIDAVADDVVAAVAWALDHRPGLALRAAPGLGEYWFRRGDPAPAYGYGVAVLEAVPDASPRLEAAARLCAGFGAVFADDLERATKGIDRAIELVEGDEDWRLLVWALLARGQSAAMIGDLATMNDAGRRIVDICDRRGEKLARAYGLALLGEAEFFADGDLSQARAYMDEAVAGFRELRDFASLNIFGLGIAASIAALQQDYESAEKLATEATTLPGPGWTATAYIILVGWVLHPHGELERAERVVLRGIELAHQMSMGPWVRNGLLFLSRISASRGEWERAAQLIGASRPQPPFGLHPRWWTHEPEVRSALGEVTFTRLVERAAARPLDEIVAWLTQ
jgi:predicted ATPase/DNA-binding SARP family transcriptional activator